MQLDLLEKGSLPVKSLNELTESVRDLLRQKPDAAVEEATRHKTPEGRDARAIQARYTFKNGRGTSLRQRFRYTGSQAASDVNGAAVSGR